MAGEIGDILSISNSLEIEGLQKSMNQQLKLQEFKERADTLGKRTGIQPTGFFEYTQNNPTEKQINPAGKWWLGLTGTLLGGLIGHIFSPAHKPLEFKSTGIGALIGGASGFVVGLFTKENDTVHFDRVLGKYDAYLHAFATQHPPLAHPAPTTAITQEAPPSQHVARLEASRTEEDKNIQQAR